MWSICFEKAFNMKFILIITKPTYSPNPHSSFQLTTVLELTCWFGRTMTKSNTEYFIYYSELENWTVKTDLGLTAAYNGGARLNGWTSWETLIKQSKKGATVLQNLPLLCPWARGLASPCSTGQQLLGHRLPLASVQLWLSGYMSIKRVKFGWSMLILLKVLAAWTLCLKDRGKFRSTVRISSS